MNLLAEMRELYPDAELIEEGHRFIEVWLCPVPALGQPYQVLEQEWLHDYDVRVIRDIRLRESLRSQHGGKGMVVGMNPSNWQEKEQR